MKYDVKPQSLTHSTLMNYTDLKKKEQYFYEHFQTRHLLLLKVLIQSSAPSP